MFFKLYYLNINKALFFFGMMVLLLALLVFPFRKSCLQVAFTLAGGLAEDPVLILDEGLSGLAFSEDGRGTLFTQAMRTLTGVDTRDAFSLLCTELNLVPTQAVTGYFAYAELAVEEEEGGEEDFYLPGTEEDLGQWIIIPEDEFPPVQLNGEPMVLIYNTHNAESYKPTQGVSRLEGKNGGIATVSKMFSKALESKYAIKTIYSEVIHDFPDFTKSYLNSMQTVKKFLKEYSKIQVVLDIHRDAGLKSRSDTLVKIKGKDYAKVMIVIGTEHERWKQNLAFARKIEKKANELYPGLIKCVRLFKDRRYNQNLHTRSLLLEIGSNLNKEEEALESAKLLAEVIAGVLKNE